MAAAGHFIKRASNSLSTCFQGLSTSWKKESPWSQWARPMSNSKLAKRTGLTSWMLPPVVEGGLPGYRDRASAGVLCKPRAKLEKAGRNRWLGRRPIVRGVAMNPVDHPHGGRTNGGKPSVSPWGKPCKCGAGRIKRKANAKPAQKRLHPLYQKLREES